MKYLTEITRILDAAMKGDRGRAIDYAKMLASKLRESDEEKAANKIEAIISNSGKLVGLQHVSGSVPVDSESRFPLADETIYSMGQVKVFFDQRVAQRLDEFLTQVGSSDKLLAAGIGVEPTLLLHGAPGTGKSLTASYVASQLGLPLLTARMDTLVSSYLGSTSKNLRNLFEHASRRPCVLFLDELDSIGKIRDDQHEMGELKRVVIALLQNIDKARGEIVIVAATNHPHILDRAIWRRFQFHLEMNLPDQDARKMIIADRIGEHQIGISTSKLALATESMSGADIANIVDDGIRNKVLNDMNELSETYLLKRIAEARLGEKVGEGASTDNQMAKVRELSPSVYTARRLAHLYDVSPATVSRRLALEKEKTDA